MREIEKQGLAVVDAAVRLVKQNFPERMLSCYQLGSLARGGFSAASEYNNYRKLTDVEKLMMKGLLPSKL